jgi:asparagine synthase (glutamine-hydrolysing)
MSGICGIYYLDGRPVDPVDLTNMVDILAHRGPDGAHIWHDGPVGLGHRMLWTTPESLTEQLPYERNGLVITADARIDNRDELIATLGLTGRQAVEIADSQLILAAYEKWGEQCPEKLLGNFAFVIWDSRKQQLFCARDHFGAKPFYYYQSHRIFTFASEIKALVCLSEVPRRLNETRVADHLLMNFEDRVITFYRDILRLSAAHSVIGQINWLKTSKIWTD